jgi:nitrogenase molybdenum-iron protein alpha/beta subunit
MSDALAYLNRLSKVNSEKNIRLFPRTPRKGLHCPLGVGLHMAGSMEGLSTLIIGTPECTTNYHYLGLLEDGGPDLHWAYVLDEKEVVFGSREGVKRAIIEMDEAGARLIMLLSTCVHNVIGEDIEGLVRELEGQIRARLFVVPTAHFLCNTAYNVYSHAFGGIAKLVEPVEQIPGSISILDAYAGMVYTPEEVAEAIAALFEPQEAINFPVFGRDTSIEQFMAASASKAALVITAEMLGFAEHLWERFDIPYRYLGGTWSYADITEALEAVAKAAGARVAKDALDDALPDLEQQARERLHGRSFVLGLGELLTNPLPLVAYLSGLGMVPLAVELPAYYTGEQEYKQSVLRDGHDPYIMCISDGNHYQQIVDTLHPDFFFGWPDDVQCLDGKTKTPDIKDVFFTDFGTQRSIRMLHALLDTGSAEKGGAYGAA